MFWGGATSLSVGSLLALPPNLGLVFGGLLLVAFGRRIRKWKWTLTISVVIMVVFGALLALARPDRKAMMIVFVVLNQLGFGWAQYLSIAFTQLGVSLDCYLPTNTAKSI